MAIELNQEDDMTTQTITPMQEVSHLVDAAVHIGVIGSPSSTTALSLDIMESAVQSKLVGELAIFRFLQDNEPHYALGQITDISLRNIWHEDPTMRSIIRQRGVVDAVSGRQDTHLGQMTVSAVFAEGPDGFYPSSLGTVPATGTRIHVVTDAVLDGLLAPYKDQLFYLGYAYGSKPKLPLWFKHFGTGVDGAGEAYHIGVFGKTGSGKSVLARMMLLAYSRHKQMGLFVLDPMGEFSMGLRNKPTKVNMGNVLCPPVLHRLERPFEVYDLANLRLARWDIFEQLLVEFEFFSMLGVKWGSYQEDLAFYVTNDLRGKYNLKQLSSFEAYTDALNSVDTNIQRVYTGQGAIDRIRTFVQEALSEGMQGNYWSRWQAITGLFTGGQGALDPGAIVSRALKADEKRRPLIVVDLSRSPEGISKTAWEDKIKPLLIDNFLDEIIRRAEREYQRGGNLNTLVVMDEAHRLAPEGRIENAKKRDIRSRLVDAVRTSRKYGLGWMFLSLTLASLDKEIRQQLRISFYGFGLASGTELQALRELVGGDSDSLRLYQQFRDPHSAFNADGREYSFMTIGPVSPLSFAGTPLFFNAFTKAQEFIETNFGKR